MEFCFGRDYLATEQGGRVVIDGEAREEWYFRAGAHRFDTERFTETNPSVFEGGYIRESADTQCDAPQPESFFTLKNVQIGKGFHWQRYQDQCFPGDLKLIAREGCVIAVNVVGIEDYLQCVIASEMSPTAGFEFLKAHAVISRSWLLAQLDKRDEVREGYSSVECDTPEELIRWQDREDHVYYDFCADDHCQRYQGIPWAGKNRHQTIAEDVREDLQNSQSAEVGFGAAPQYNMIRKTKRVIDATWGQVLWYDGRVCDARFSKCCGGALEEFKYCWENKEVPYLRYARDYETVTPGGERRPDGLLVAAGDVSAMDHPGLRDERDARRWILSSPRAFCNTRSKRLLGQVLKDYDSETKDFYRWTVEYTAEELRQIILERTGDDYGQILDLIPLERGVSGRICRLKIVGSKKAKTIGKELEIRRTLSRSYLYSSAFVVEKVYGPNSANIKAGAQKPETQLFSDNNPTGFDGGNVAQSPDTQRVVCQLSEAGFNPSSPAGGIPSRFILHGAGWGHGVGLCQIGAAAMGARGYDYRTILQHYYPSAEIRSIYPLSREQRDSDDVVFASGKKQKTAKYLSRGQRGTSDGVLAPHNKDK